MIILLMLILLIDFYREESHDVLFSQKLSITPKDCIDYKNYSVSNLVRLGVDVVDMLS